MAHLLTCGIYGSISPSAAPTRITLGSSATSPSAVPSLHLCAVCECWSLCTPWLQKLLCQTRVLCSCPFPQGRERGPDPRLTYTFVRATTGRNPQLGRNHLHTSSGFTRGPVVLLYPGFLWGFCWLCDLREFS